MDNVIEQAADTLLILGNGFDIDLGFPTRYKDFFLSDSFPFVNNELSCHSLGHYVYEKGIHDKWYDLENILAEYGSGVAIMDEEAVEGDKEDYRKLVQGLTDYLGNIDYSQPKRDSVAANILTAAHNYVMPSTVYTFNYTDFEKVSQLLGIGFSDAFYVHGSLKNKNIVLGVGEYKKLGPYTSYLHKTAHPGYDSHGILNAFESYDTIIIFGLSLSQVDYPYFEDFFKDVASRKYMGDRQKYIRIFTYDENSRLEILDNLRGMNSGLIKLMGYSDFDIIRTKDDIDALKVQEVIGHLSAKWRVEFYR